MDGQEINVKGKKYGGTLRLGTYACRLADGTFSREAYKQAVIKERHRHRYEFNNTYRAELEEAGLVIAGTSPDNSLVEIVEIANHPFFVGVQFHPEFQSRPLDPHPLFVGLLKAANAKK
jgi:CTP synthase